MSAAPARVGLWVRLRGTPPVGLAFVRRHPIPYQKGGRRMLRAELRHCSHWGVVGGRGERLGLGWRHSMKGLGPDSGVASPRLHRCTPACCTAAARAGACKSISHSME